MKIRLPLLPLSLHWIAEHIGYQENEYFVDIQRKGPFRHWRHMHIFRDAAKGCELEDRIEYALPCPPLGERLGKRLVDRELRRIFAYRQRTLSGDFNDHAGTRPKSILISGASGVLGSDLIPYLTTAGHRVIRLVRRAPLDSNEIYWNPEQDILDLKGVGPLDAVINLSGENIGQSRWSPEKKQAFLDSRMQSTELLVKSLGTLDPPPEVLINASAIGYYGNRPQEAVAEEDPPGFEFIAEICKQWEQAAGRAQDQGIRVALLRMGVVLTPKGGALKQMLPAFRLGLGGPMGSGEQGISWISMDDLLGVINTILHQKDLDGPINAVSPHPVSNRLFAATLGRVLHRPALLRLPQGMITLLFGQMGREVLLSGAKVRPDKLLQAGYAFRHPELEPALRHLLGRSISQ